MPCFWGHVGDVELGASALAGIWFLAIYMLGFGFSLGLQVVIARRNGEQRYSETGKTFFQGFSFLLSLAVVLCLLSQILSPVLLKHLIASGDVYNAVICLFGRTHLGTVFLLSVSCLTFILGRHHADKSPEHGGFYCRAGKYSHELASDIRFRYGHIGGGYRIVIGRTVFVNRPDNLCVSTHQQASVWLTLEHGYDSTERNLFLSRYGACCNSL